mgnify:CR=1 FL=1
MSNISICPTNAEELCDLVQASVSSGSPLSVNGNGSKQGWGHTIHDCQKLNVYGMSGITLYEPQELVMTAAAGTPISDIKKLLEQNNQQLDFEPPNLERLYGGYADTATLGGVLACNLAGPGRIQTGAARDHFLGFEAVSGRGEIFKSGGRVVKNVTGFDLSKLLAGSFGTLAIMTSITIKVLPRPEKTRSILLYGLDDEDAVSAMALALNSSYQVNAAAHLPENLAIKSSVDYVENSGSSVTAVRIQGPASSVEARSVSLQNLLGQFGDVEELHSHNSTALWNEVADVVDIIDDPSKMIWRLSGPPTRGASISRAVKEHTNAEVYFDWGGGLLWIGHPTGDEQLAGKMRLLIGDDSGHATLMRASDSVRETIPVFHPQAREMTALASRLKENFDPQGILNPGRMYAIGL